MDFKLQSPSRRRITSAPRGRGWKPRPERVVNAEYVQQLLEQNRLTERDETLFRYLDSLPVLSTQQIRRLLWFDSSRSNMHRRLRQLYDYHFLDRARMLNKKEGITYTLGKAGRIWLHGEAGDSTGPRVDVQMLKHDLAIAELLVILTEELRQADPEGRLDLRLEWLNETKARVMYKDQVLLEPDGLVRIWDGDQCQGGYLEVDIGADQEAPFERKLARYFRVFQQTGLHNEGSPDGRHVIIVTSTDQRATDMASTIVVYKERRDFPSLSWYVGVLSEIQQHGFFDGARWYGVKNNQRLERDVWPAPWNRSGQEEVFMVET